VTAPPSDDTAAATLPRCYRHPDRETGVRCTRCERPICPDCMVAASVGFQCPDCVREGRRSVRPIRTAYGGRPSGGELTKALVGINIVIYLISGLSSGDPITPNPTASIYRSFALVPVAVAHGEWWRLVSSTFLHYNVPHIVFNMWALYVIGVPLERLLGRVRFLVLYLLAGIGGGIMSFALGNHLESAAGASGAIFGLFGAFFVVARRRNLETGGIVALIAINLVFSFTFSGIDWRGHVGGLIVGSAVAAVLVWAPPGPQRTRIQAAGCAVIALVLAASGLVAAHKIVRDCPDYPIRSSVALVSCAA
jgi:membrane associated rhomboid family serine protease